MGQVVANHSRVRDVVFVATWLGVLGAAIVLLVNLGAGDLGIPVGDLGRWALVTPADVVAMAVARMIALAGVLWLLVGTALYALARCARLPSAIRAVEWMALPTVRRVLARLTAAGLAATITSAPAITTSSAALAFDQAHAVGSVSADAAQWWPLEPDDGADEKQVLGVSDAGSQPGRQHLVVAGDNLWNIAATELAQRSGRAVPAVGPAEITEYWMAVVDANKARLASGDPDLIYAGETILLPT